MDIDADRTRAAQSMIQVAFGQDECSQRRPLKRQYLSYTLINRAMAGEMRSSILFFQRRDSENVVWKKHDPAGSVRIVAREHRLVKRPS